MVVLFAKGLAAKGYEVIVYCTLNQFPRIDQGVQYYHLTSLAHREQSGVLIAFKEPDALLIEGFEQRYLWTADPTTLSATQRKMCDGFFAISKWHESELKGINIGYPRISYIEPGIDIDREKKVKRVKKQCLYASSPDRGLDFLHSIWPEVTAAHPDANLIITYDVKNRRTNEEMDDLYRQSDILAYPCSGQERFCLTAMKAQLYGTIPCVVPHMALQNTVQYGIKCLKKDYTNAIIKLLDNNNRDLLREDMMINTKFNTWDDVIDKWERIIGKERQNQNRA